MPTNGYFAASSAESHQRHFVVIGDNRIWFQSAVIQFETITVSEMRPVLQLAILDLNTAAFGVFSTSSAASVRKAMS